MRFWISSAELLHRSEGREFELFKLRLAAVQNYVAALCEMGALLAYGRPAKGGEMTPIPRTWWNSERLGPRFVRCQVNPNEPHGGAFAGNDFWFIFIENGSLRDRSYPKICWQADVESSKLPPNLTE